MHIAHKVLPQLYRFCFLMLGDAERAQEVFQRTLRDAALRAAHSEPPADRLWFFCDARERCLEVAEKGLQAEPGQMEEHEISAAAPLQIAQLDPGQLAVWISAASEPQRTALALHYLDEFNLREMLLILQLKPADLPRLLARGRREFQAWLDATIPREEET